MAAVTTVLCLTAVACGNSDGETEGAGGRADKAGAAGASRTPDAASTPPAAAESAPAPVPTSNGRKLTEAELAKVALTGRDLHGYGIAPMEGGDERGTEKSGNEACRPLVAVAAKMP